MNRWKSISLVLLLIVPVPGCATSPSQDSMAEWSANRAELHALNQALVDGWLAGDQEAVMKHFADDAVLLPHHGESPVRNTEDIRKYLWPAGLADAEVTTFEMTPKEVEAQEHVGYIHGTFELELNYTEDRRPTIYRNHGNYVLLFHRKGDQAWKIARLMWTDRPVKPVGLQAHSPPTGLGKELTGEVWAGVAHRVFGGDDADRRVEFVSPVPLDWDALAETQLLSAATAQSEEQKAELERHIDGRSQLFPPERSSLGFEAPLSEALRAKHYYLVSEEGIQEVAPAKLTGRMLFQRPIGSDKWEKTGALGGIEGTIADGKIPLEGGVVIVSSQPLEMSFQRVYETAPLNGFAFSRMRWGERVRWLLSDSGGYTGPVFLAPSWYTDYAGYRHASMITIETTGQRYLLVSWEPVVDMDSGCSWDFDLFEVIKGQDLNAVVSGANCSTLV